MKHSLGIIGIAFGGILALSGCGDSVVAGRPNSSETENALAARLVDSRGRPVAGARVGISDSASWERGFLDRSGVFAFQDVTDDSGRVRFRLPSGARWVAYATTSSEGIFLPIDPTDSAATWTAAPLGSISGRLVGVPSDASRLCLRGTDRCADLAADGGYHFADLPRGVYTPILSSDPETTLRRLGNFTIKADSSAPADTALVSADTILLDDFEDGDAFGNLRTWTGSSKWWVYSVLSTSIPSGVSEFPGRLVADSTRAGKVLEVTTGGMDSANGSLVLVGLDLGTGTQATDSAQVFADLSEMRSLRFRIKGNGAVTILLQTRRVLQLGDDQQLHANVPLDGAWQDIVLRPSDFTTYPGSMAAKAGLGFADLSDRTSAIVFQFRTDGDYRLDDLRIEGPEILFLRGWRD